MEMILLNVNNPSASIITFFRLIPENSKGVMGADIATTNKYADRPTCFRNSYLKVPGYQGQNSNHTHFGIDYSEYTGCEDEYK